MKAVVDRFESSFAVLLLEGEQTTINVPRKQLPRGTHEGDYLKVELQDGKVTKAERNPEATQQAKERIAAKLQRLRRGDHLLPDE